MTMMQSSVMAQVVRDWQRVNIRFSTPENEGKTPFPSAYLFPPRMMFAWIQSTMVVVGWE